MAHRRLAAAVLLSMLVCAAAEVLPEWYQCDCSARSNCYCPSTASPGGLALKDTPQFILFTHDDAILPTTDKAFRSVCDGRRNPNGCELRATMFTQQAQTDCGLAKKMYDDGYEIATHTMNHVPMPDGFPVNDTAAEILGARRFLSELCGIPEEDIRGFRSPYLVTNPVVRQTLFEHGFLYDSTLLETGTSESVSTSFAKRVWPYTLDFGVAQNCAWFSNTQKCDNSERWPGLWEIPMWVIQVLGLEFTMDVGYYGGRGVYEPLMEAFDQAYNGNRAPLPIYIHTTWVDKDPRRVEELQRFADYTLTKPDVYWVTMSQLLDWIKNPVPVSQLARSKAMCTKPPAPAPPPALPKLGANITMHLAGATKTQVADQQERLEAAVAKLLGSQPSSTFVAEVSPSSIPGSSATPSLSTMTVQSVEATAGSIRDGSISTTTGFPQDGFMQFEGPSYVPTRSADAAVRRPADSAASDTLSVMSAEPDTIAALKVTVAAAGADPLALYQHASLASRRATLADDLSAMGLNLAGQAEVVPFKDGAVLGLSPPASPPPAPQPAVATTPVVPEAPKAAAPKAPQAAAPSGAGSGAAEATAEQTYQASSSAVTSGSSEDSSSGGLNAGAIAGIVISTTTVLVAALVVAVVYVRRRRGQTATGAAPYTSFTDGSPVKTPRDAADAVVITITTP